MSEREINGERANTPLSLSVVAIVVVAVAQKITFVAGQKKN